MNKEDIIRNILCKAGEDITVLFDGEVVIDFKEKNDKKAGIKFKLEVVLKEK